MIPKIEDKYTYDGMGLRRTETINGTTLHLTWDTAEPIALILSNEKIHFIYGPENIPVEQVPQKEGKGAESEVLYLHHDQQGSTRLTTNTKGETEGTISYSPYGATTATSGTLNTPLRYDGQYTSTDTGLIYLRARTYDPTTAQFLSLDPALEATGEAYIYAKDNPENDADPTGECSQTCEKLKEEYEREQKEAQTHIAEANKLLREAREWLDKIDESHWYYGWANHWYLSRAHEWEWYAHFDIEWANEENARFAFKYALWQKVCGGS